MDSIEDLTDYPRMTLCVKETLSSNLVLAKVFTWSTNLKPVNEFFLEGVLPIDIVVSRI